MADIQHATLSEGLLHYPKGASTAANNTWLKSNGDSTTTFTALPTTELTVLDTIASHSTINQELTTQGTEVQVLFGSTITSPTGAITVNSDGSIRINQSGVYDFNLNKSAGRSTNAGVNTIAFCARLNGAQIGESSIITLDNSEAGVTVPSSVAGLAQLSIGDTLTYHMRYHTGASGNIGIYTATITDAAWGDVPSASVSVSKIGI